MLPGVGFFGCGALAQILLQQLQEHGFRVLGLWAPRESEAAALAGQRGIPFHSTIIDKVLLLPAVQLVVAACPAHYHHQIASKACGIGKHVVCDWPPAHTLPDAGRIRMAAANYPKLIAILLTALRFVPGLQMMRRLICQDRILGPVRLVNATVLCDFRFGSWGGGGGGLLTLFGINLIDIIGYVTGCRARRVHGRLHSVRQNPILAMQANEDFVSCQLELYPAGDQPEDSILATMTLNGHNYNYPVRHELFVHGSHGYLVCRDGDIYAYRESVDGGSDTGNGAILAAPARETLVSKSETGGAGFLSLSNGAGSIYPRLYLLGIRNLVQALKNAFESHTKWDKAAVAEALGLDEAVYLQAVLEAIKLSSEQREWVRVPHQ